MLIFKQLSQINRFYWFLVHWIQQKQHIRWLQLYPTLLFFDTHMITNLSTAPVKCSHCTLFSESNTVRVAKNAVITTHRKHIENFMIEWEYCRYFLLTYSLSSALMTSHRRHSLRLSLNWSRQSLVLGSNCRRRSLTKASTNGFVALNAWYSRMGGHIEYLFK